MKKYVKNFMRYKFLLAELVKKGVKLKYRRSYLGIIWSLLEPLLTTVVLAVVFGTLFGNKNPDFPVYILSGRLLYTFFSQATKDAMKSIRVNAAMIKKVYVPKYLYPLAQVMFNYVIFAISLIVLILLCVVFKVFPTFYTLGAVVPLLTLFVFALGVGMILATIGVFFRDMEYLWNVGLMLVMYACAIFYYPEKLLNSPYFWILKYNPLYCIISNFRCAVYGQPLHWMSMLYACGVSAACLLAGVFIFKKKQDEFILHI